MITVPVAYETVTALEYVQRLALKYASKSHDPRDWEGVTPTVEDSWDGVWHLVGHNATHYFYLSVDNGRVFVRSEDCEDGKQSYREADLENLGYIGHW